jgi:hypothetical protein
MLSAAISQRLPETVATVERNSAAPRLPSSPTAPASPVRPAGGCHGSRRRIYRTVYRIDEAARVVHVLDIDHRSDNYHRPDVWSGAAGMDRRPGMV